MDGLTLRQRELRQECVEFARAHLNHDIPRRHREGDFDMQAWRACGSARLHGLPLPPDLGGRGCDAGDTMAALEGLGYGCEDGGLVFALGAQLFACTIPVWQYGREDQRSRFLPGLCDGSLIATNAMTEAAGGSAAFQMNSTAEFRDGAYHLQGDKSFCANAPVSSLCLGYVLTDPAKGFAGGATAFLLERQRHRYAVTAEVEKLGLRTCTTGRISLDGIIADEEDALGGRGAGGTIFNRSMEWERIGMSALHVGTMTRLLERAVAWARSRKPGGIAISRHQAVSHALADIRTDIDAARLLVYQAAAGLDTGAGTGPAASITKLFVSERFKSMAVRLMQIYAGTGYEADSEIARVLQDALASTIYSGTSEIQRNIIARWMGC